MEEINFANDFLDFSDMPADMGALLEQAGTDSAFTKGKIVHGKVAAKRQDGALIDIGYKAEGFIPASEFLKYDEVNVGDKIDVEGFLYWYNGAQPHVTAVYPTN